MYFYRIFFNLTQLTFRNNRIKTSIFPGSRLLIFYCMSKIIFLLFFSLFVLSEPVVTGGIPYAFQDPDTPGEQDTTGRQVLYNGRLWRNIYYMVKGDQFLFTSSLLPGSVSIDGRVFKDVLLCYDIFKDELLAMNDNGMMIQLNKEKIDRFTYEFNNRTYKFKNLDADSLNNLSGYVNVLFEGDLSLVVKYKKEIVMLAVENKYDEFNQIQRIFLKKDDKYYLIRGKRDFLKQLIDRKQQIKQYIRTNKLQVTKSNPESFVPVLEFYTNLNK